jgi:dienelactone hydrolase
MLGIIILLMVLGIEVGYSIYCMVTKSYHQERKLELRILLFTVFSSLILMGIIQWSFRWSLLFFVLLIRTLISIWKLVKKQNKKEKIYKKRYVIMTFIGNAFILFIALLPSLIFPQMQPTKMTGAYDVNTVTYTLTDKEREETFGSDSENRQVTIQFWYPSNDKETYPLVVFSHGAFGYRTSNMSTYYELASNGYVVCSIDHTYHAFYTKQTDGKVIIANQEFLMDAMAAQNGEYDETKTFQISRDWLKLRTEDMSFVLNTILENTSKPDSDAIYQLINPEQIGLFGHSLGGATAAEIGRERTDIDAAIVIDGTMLGEAIGMEDGITRLNPNPYPIPLLNLYNEDHYNQAISMEDTYENMVATKNAIDARTVIIKDSGHINFTDLPMYSPFLASLLGIGEVDGRYCIETMNDIILNYFNYYLKDTKELNLQMEY